MPLHWVRHKSRQIIRFWRQKGDARILPLLSAIRVGGLLAAALALWGFAAIADEVLENETQKFDRAILQALLRLHTPWLDRLMQAITFVGEPSFLLVISLIVASWLLFRRRRSAATTLAIACIGAIGLNFLLKNLFARARPMLWQRSVDVSFYSFPSGHAMVSLVIYGMLSYLLATRFHRYRKSIFSVTILLIAAIGFSRLYLGVHWPTDVIAGYAAGFVWLIACIFSLEVWRQRHSVRNLSEEN